jgi:hypothetical protein
LRLAHAISRDRVAAPRRVMFRPVNNSRRRIVPAGTSLALAILLVLAAAIIGRP